MVKSYLIDVFGSNTLTIDDFKNKDLAIASAKHWFHQSGTERVHCLAVMEDGTMKSVLKLGYENSKEEKRELRQERRAWDDMISRMNAKGAIVEVSEPELQQLSINPEQGENMDEDDPVGALLY